MNSVVKFEPGTFVEKLREKMKAALLDLIPEEQWESMLKAEVDAFFKNKTVQVNTASYYRNEERAGGFRSAVREVLTAETKKRVLAMLETDEWSGHWDGSRQVAGKTVAKIVRENAAEILENMFSMAAQNAVNALRQAMR